MKFNKLFFYGVLFIGLLGEALAVEKEIEQSNKSGQLPPYTVKLDDSVGNFSSRFLSNFSFGCSPLSFCISRSSYDTQTTTFTIIHGDTLKRSEVTIPNCVFSFKNFFPHPEGILAAICGDGTSGSLALIALKDSSVTIHKKFQGILCSGDSSIVSQNSTIILTHQHMKRPDGPNLPALSMHTTSQDKYLTIPYCPLLIPFDKKVIGLVDGKVYLINPDLALENPVEKIVYLPFSTTRIAGDGKRVILHGHDKDSPFYYSIDNMEAEEPNVSKMALSLPKNYTPVDLCIKDNFLFTIGEHNNSKLDKAFCEKEKDNGVFIIYDLTMKEVLHQNFLPHRPLKIYFTNNKSFIVSEIHKNEVNITAIDFKYKF